MTLSGQVELIRQAFGYVSQFRGKLFVIKIDTDIIMDPLFPVLVSDLALLHRLGIRIAIVPGSQTRIDEILTKYGIQWKVVGGVRISTPEAIPFIKMAAFDVSNRIMTLLAENRVDGVIGNWVRARAIGVRAGVDYQETGLVDRIKGDMIRAVLADGMIPIFPNIGWSAGGRPYNISSDELAAALASEMLAEKLFFMTTRQGVPAADYRLPEDIEPPREGYLSEAHRRPGAPPPGSQPGPARGSAAAPRASRLPGLPSRACPASTSSTGGSTASCSRRSSPARAPAP